MREVRAIIAAALVGLSCTAARALVGPSQEGGPLAAHVVMVLKRAPEGAGFCSGVVLAPTVVLTAAHCVASVADTRVHFRADDGRPMLREVAAIAVHPQYRANAIQTRQRTIDLALVRLAAPLPARFAPVDLAPAAPAPGAALRIAGYGLTQEGRAETSGTLRSGALVLREPRSTILLWAEDPRHAGFGACTGDSGGPIFAGTEDALVAITDWSAGTSAARHCGGLTQGTLVAPQRGWIAHVLGSWGLRP